MKRTIALVLVAVFALAVPAALASDVPRCTLNVSTTAASTASPTSGTCGWSTGQVVKIQCNVAVYYRADGTAATADANSVKVDFTVNPDAYTILLQPGVEKNISVITASGTGTCGFFTPTERR